MGGVYLSYSAYFLSTGFTGVRQFMIAIMILMYLLMGAVNIRSLLGNIKMLKAYIEEDRNGNLNIVLPSLKLKCYIL